MEKMMKGMGLVPKAQDVKLPKMAMPDPTTFGSKLAARKKAEEEQKKRQGRASTIKTPQVYKNLNLGGTA